MPDPLHLRGTVYWAPVGTPPPGEHDQGDEPAEHPCPACVGGWHGEHCRGEFWTTGEQPELVECDCIEGACRGEWTELGYVEASGAAALRAEEAARRPGGAYAGRRDGLTSSPVAAPPAGENPADNGRSVNSPDTRTPVRASFRAVPVPSPAVTTGLGREHIDTHRHIPAPGRVELPAALGGIPEDAPEQQLVLLNRADRRARARKARRRG